MNDSLTRLTTALTDRYLIERELGAGGMATVYLAHDVRHDRPVALKLLRPELAAILGGERFLKEIRLTANLQHPHILGLHDSGEVDGLVYYVMPYVEGESLRQRLEREHQLPVEEAIRIATEVAGALDYAHRHGVIHRDIKPENILLHDGSAMVADFGIALAASRSDSGSRLTETGMSLGTPHYMSPEQAMGEREITAKSDVYALGCVVYEMLSGEPPFTGPTAQAIVARVMMEQPRSLTLQRHSIPPHVEAAVDTGVRIDGRDVKTVRPIISEVGILPRKDFKIAFKFLKCLDPSNKLVNATTWTPDDVPWFIAGLNWTFGAQANIFFSSAILTVFPPTLIPRTKATYLKKIPVHLGRSAIPFTISQLREVAFTPRDCSTNWFGKSAFPLTLLAR